MMAMMAIMAMMVMMVILIFCAIEEHCCCTQPLQAAPTTDGTRDGRDGAYDPAGLADELALPGKRSERRRCSSAASTASTCSSGGRHASRAARLGKFPAASCPRTPQRLEDGRAALERKLAAADERLHDAHAVLAEHLHAQHVRHRRDEDLACGQLATVDVEPGLRAPRPPRTQFFCCVVCGCPRSVFRETGLE